jgi:hypothetical protein
MDTFLEPQPIDVYVFRDLGCRGTQDGLEDCGVNQEL